MRARRTIAQLCNTDGVLKIIGHALKETLQNDLTPKEKQWIEKIELLRKELNSSTTRISVIDYGAGKSSCNLTNEEMYKGRIITKTVGEVSWSASKPYFWSLLLFKIIRKFKPYICLELGTCLGISAAYQAVALKFNEIGKIITLEGAESLATLAEGNFQALSLDNINIVIGRFQDTLDEVLKTYKSIDYVFIDGHHDEKATLAYFQKIIPFLSERSLLVFDDISWSDGMKRAWKTIITDERVKISVDLWQIGVCMIDNRIEGKQNITIPMV